MKHLKDYNWCVSKLLEAHRASELEPEQLEEIEKAIAGMRELRRMNHPARAKVLKIVRLIAENLLKAFSK